MTYINERAEQDIGEVTLGQWYSVPPQEVLDSISEAINAVAGSIGGDGEGEGGEAGPTPSEILGAPPGTTLTPAEADAAIGDKLAASITGGPPVTDEEWQAWIQIRVVDPIIAAVPEIVAFINGLFPTKLFAETSTQGEEPTPAPQLCAQGIIDVTVTEVARRHRRHAGRHRRRGRVDLGRRRSSRPAATARASASSADPPGLGPTSVRPGEPMRGCGIRRTPASRPGRRTYCGPGAQRTRGAVTPSGEDAPMATSTSPSTGARRPHSLPTHPSLRRHRRTVVAWSLAHGHPVDRDALAVLVGLRSRPADGALDRRWTTDDVDDRPSIRCVDLVRGARDRTPRRVRHHARHLPALPGGPPHARTRIGPSGRSATCRHRPCRTTCRGPVQPPRRPSADDPPRSSRSAEACRRAPQRTASQRSPKNRSISSRPS